MPAFKRAIVDAGTWSIMSAYHSYVLIFFFLPLPLALSRVALMLNSYSYDGIPSVSDAYTLTDILRGELDYKYWVVSDAGATDRVCTYFKMCQGNPIDSDAVTLEILPAGTDVEMGGESLYVSLLHSTPAGLTWYKATSNKFRASSRMED